MRRRLLWMLPLISACATGLPVGGRTRIAQARYRPLTPPSPPRSVPVAQQQAVADPIPPVPAVDTPREELVALAQSAVGRLSQEDCAQLVARLYEKVGVPLLGPGARSDNAVTSMFRNAQSKGRIFRGGRPLPGDLVFYRDTYDVNRDGRMNDGLSHVGIVETVDDTGTISVIHKVATGVVRYRMNLRHPNVRQHPETGRTFNDALRVRGKNGSAVLTGQLFAAYATIFP